VIHRQFLENHTDSFGKVLELFQLEVVSLHLLEGQKLWLKRLSLLLELGLLVQVPESLRKSGTHLIELRLSHLIKILLKEIKLSLYKY
jgi:hypothetical protein